MVAPDGIRIRADPENDELLALFNEAVQTVERRVSFVGYLARPTLYLMIAVALVGQYFLPWFKPPIDLIGLVAGLAFYLFGAISALYRRTVAGLYLVRPHEVPSFYDRHQKLILLVLGGLGTLALFVIKEVWSRYSRG